MSPHGKTSPRASMTRRNAIQSATLGGAAFLGGTVLLGKSPSYAAVASNGVKHAQPTVFTRADWRARPAPFPRVLATPPNYIVVHHTATRNSTDYSQGHAFALSRRIQAHHMDTNGWSDIGQQLTISRGGYVMEGRDRSLPAIRAGRGRVRPAEHPVAARSRGGRERLGARLRARPGAGPGRPELRRRRLSAPGVRTRDEPGHPGPLTPRPASRAPA